MSFFKTLLFVVALLSLSFTLHAQTPAFGVQAGYGIANIFAYGSGDDYRGVYHVGILWHIDLGNRWAIATKLMFNQRGSKSGGDVSGSISNGYLNIPVTARFYFKDITSDATNNGYLLFGPSVGFMLYSGLKVDGLDGTTDTEALYNPWDAGLHVGAGFETKTQKSAVLFVELDCYFGVANIFDKREAGPAFSDTRVLNRGFTLGTGIRF